MWLLSAFKFLGRLIAKAFEFAKSNGLTDELVGLARELALKAAGQIEGNAERREWVVRQLVTRGVPESVARLALELAVQLIKKEAQP